MKRELLQSFMEWLNKNNVQKVRESEYSYKGLVNTFSYKQIVNLFLKDTDK